MSRKPSNELQGILDNLEFKAAENFKIGNLQKSFRYYQEMLNTIYSTQEKEKRSIHKGLPLHMMG